MTHRHVLLSVVGTSPQVVTETIFGFYKSLNIAISEIHVITTDVGAESLLGVWGERGKEGRFQDHLRDLSKQLRIKQPRFTLKSPYLTIVKDEDLGILDIDTLHSGYAFTDAILQKLMALTSSNSTVVHGSFAGGRKSMSVAMAVGMMLLGRKPDTLTQVIVDKDLEKTGKPFPTSPEESRSIRLVPYPFVRLRHKFPFLRTEPVSYRTLVEKAQEEIDLLQRQPMATLHAQRRELEMENVRIKLTPLQFAVYYYIAHQSKPIPVSQYNFSSTTQRELLETYKIYATKDSVSLKSEGISFEDLQKARSQINRKVSDVLRDNPNLRFYLIVSEGEYAKKAYSIPLGSKSIKDA